MNINYLTYDIDIDINQTDNGFHDGTLYEVKYNAIIDSEGNMLNEFDLPDNILYAIEQYAIDTYRFG